MKRRLLAGLLISAMALSMMACGSQPVAPSDAVVEDDDAEETAVAEETQSEESTETEPQIEVVEGYTHTDEILKDIDAL